MVESLPTMVDKHIKEQVKMQVPKQECGKLQAKISSQIQKAIDTNIPSLVDAFVRSYMFGHILHGHPAQTQTTFVLEQQYQLYLSMKADPQLQQQDIAIWLALQMKFEILQVPQTTCRTPTVRLRDQDDSHNDAHLEGENSAKRQKTSEYEAHVTRESFRQVNEKEQGQSSSRNQEQTYDYDFWTESYASDDGEVPTKQVSQDIIEEVSPTINEAKLKKITDEMLRQRFQSCQRDPEAPSLSLINQDLLNLKKGSSGPEKIVLSLHKFPGIIFNDVDIEERTSRRVNKCVKKFNPYARYGVEHWKNPHSKIFYIKMQKEPGKPKEVIVARRANECIVSITEPNYKNLNKNDIKDTYLLIMIGKVPNYAETGNVVAARAESNANGNNGNQIRCYNYRGLSHLTRNCTVRPRRRDVAYLQTHLLIAQKEEAGIQLQAEEFDLMAAAVDLDEIEEVNANCILMANLQQASTSGTQTDKALVYDLDGSAEVSSVEQDGETIDQHPTTVEETRAYFELLYNNLAIDVEKVNTVNHKLRETNDDLTTKLPRYKNQEMCFEISQEKYDKLERCYPKFVYKEQCLTKKINALHLSYGKQITTLNEEISNLNNQLSKEKSTISSLLEEKKKLKSDFKIREDELLNKQIQLKNKIKELDNILVKTSQSIQTMHILSPKPDSFYHTEQKMALGYQNPFYLKQAQQKQQSLYNGKVLLEKHDHPIVYDLEETLQLAQESRLKMKQLNKEIKLANYTKINHLLRVFVSQTAKSCEELYFSNTSKMANVSKPISIPNIEFSNDTTPSVARKFLNEVKNTIVTRQHVVKQKMTLDIHNWSSSVHQEIHKIVNDEIFPIVNQVDARLQNFKINFLKEAAKFDSDFKSLAKEADESLAKHKALELEIERLLRVVVSQDIMSIVQSNSVVDTSNQQTELEHTKEPYNDMQQKIERLQAQLGDLKGRCEDTPCVSDTLDPFSQTSKQKDTAKGIDNTAKTRRLQPRSNTKNDRVPCASKSNCSKNTEVEVEVHPRNLMLSKNKKHMSSECNNIKLAIRNEKAEVVCAMCKKCLITSNHDVCVLNNVNDMNSRLKKLNANVSNTANEKKHKLKVLKPKKVGSKGKLVSAKPRKPRTCLRWSPTRRIFNLKGKIIESSETESQSDCSNSDNACTPNPNEPTSKRFPNSTFSLAGHSNLFMVRRLGMLKHMTRNLKLLVNFIWKFLRTVRFGNDHVAAILGYGELHWGIF
ncbi:hypothetical protein Tco_0683625 [Tanacetum coccineum]